MKVEGAEQDDYFGVRPISPAVKARGVCGICVTYHPDPGLPGRLAAVLSQVSELVIVDNGSDPPELEMLRALAARDVALIINGENLGIARALNIGIEQALSRGYDWALLLDQDTRVHHDLVASLLSIRDAYPAKERLAVVGSGYFDPLRPTRQDASDSAWEEVASVITSGSLICLRAYQKIGRFREEFFIDYVDIDYCTRAHSLGFTILKAKSPLMSHTIGSPTSHKFLWTTKWTSNHSADRRYYQARNDTVMLHESPKYRGGAWFFKSLGRSIRTCKRILLYESDKSAKILSVLQGWLDALRGTSGPRKRFQSRWVHLKSLVF